MADTLFIVEDADFLKLPQSVRDQAVAETKRLFASIRGLGVTVRQPAQFPATLDFSDSVVKIVATEGEVSAAHNLSVRQQMANIRYSIKQNGMAPPANVAVHFPATPERGGVGFQQKEIITVGTVSLAMTMTGGVASVEAVKAEVTEAFAGGRTKDEILDAQDKAIKKKGLGYFGKHQSLVDTRGLYSHELMDKPLADWPSDYQNAVGAGLGRLIAHEARHQYVLPHFNGPGLGAGAAALWGDKNFEQFDSTDLADISTRMQLLRLEQQRAAILLETLPRGQPFMF